MVSKRLLFTGGVFLGEISMKLGLIDLGSNSARMYLLEYKDGAFRITKRRRVMCRLSEGMSESLQLQPEAINRTVQVLADFSREIACEDAVPFAVATAAMRKAKNREAVLEQIRQETGISLSVISGEAEAYFDFQGVLAELPDVKDCLICDTGGGSTELILCKNRTLAEKISLPFGAMTLTENYGQSVLDARAALEEELDKVLFLKEAEGIPLVGIGGSVCALYGVEHPGTRTGLNGYRFLPQRVEALFAQLYALNAEERILAGVEKGRADTICGGLFPALILLQKFHLSSLTLSVGGLREGIMAELAKEKPLFYVQNPEDFFEKYLDYTRDL